MADLRNGETLVGPKNDSAKGPSGKRARDRASLYMLVGGSSDIYDVTVNFESKNGHWCQKESGARCHGNGNGKGQKYGPPQSRDKHDPNQWCKHVQAALADVEGLAEAEERTACAFGEKARVVIKPAVEKPSPSGIAPQPVQTARERLATLEAEAARLRESLKAEELSELRSVVKGLLDRFEYDEIVDALKDVA